MDAIDHRLVLPWLPDLSTAAFEVIGSNDVDNPGVPNMQRVLAESGHFLGHGMDFYNPYILVLAEPVDVPTLPSTTIGAIADPYYRIPADRVLDVMMVIPTPATEALSTRPLCPRLLYEGFDTQAAALQDYSAQYTFARRLLGVLPTGQRVLQRTRASGRDLEPRFPHTPRAVP